MSVKLTDNELALLKRLNENPYADSPVFDNLAWSYNVLKGPADNATFGSLVTKGLVHSEQYDGEECYLLLEPAAEFLK